jgi:creatinine amidohydrolase
MQAKKLYWHEYSYPEIKERVKELKLVLIPTGSIEQHGPHLSIIHDYQSALLICEEVTRRLWPDLLILKAFQIGVSSHHITPKFAGTISLKVDTYINVLVDIAHSLKMSGVKKALIVNGHGGNEAANKIACKRVREEVGLELGAISYWRVLETRDYEQLGFGWPRVGHSGEFETSIALARFPENVRLDKIGEEDRYSIEGTNMLSNFSYFLYLDEITKLGYTDNPKRASAEKGEKAFQLIVDKMIKNVKLFIDWKPKYKSEK